MPEFTEVLGSDGKYLTEFTSSVKEVTQKNLTDLKSGLDEAVKFKVMSRAQ